jgi:hypothetical protein
MRRSARLGPWLRAALPAQRAYTLRQAGRLAQQGRPRFHQLLKTGGNIRRVTDDSAIKRQASAIWPNTTGPV